MRILLLNYEFPPIGAGAANASAQIARHLSRCGHEVVVLTSHVEGLKRRQHKDGYTIYRVPVSRKRIDRCTVPEMGAFMLRSAGPALRLARAFRPDLMYVFFGMPTGPVGLLVNRLLGIPYLLSLRGGDVPGFLSDDLAWMHRLTAPMTHLVWSKASAIVVNSEGLRDLAQQTVPGRHIDVIQNGVDTDLFHPGEPSMHAGAQVKVLFVGRLVRQKGVTYLLQSLARLEPALCSKIAIEVVGKGPEEESLRAQTRELGLDAQVRFSGWASRDEIVQRYQQADIFALPSFEEGMPNVVLEAMACGLPIIATDIYGNRELVENNVNGLLFPPADVAALTGALRKLVGDKTLQVRMGKASRARACNMSWASVADRYMVLSENIVAAPAARHLQTVEKRK